MSTADIAVTVVFLAAFTVGFRGTWRQIRRYGGASPLLTEPRSYLVLVAFVMVSIPIVAAAGVLGVLGLRRMAGMEPLPVGGVLTLVLAIAIVWIPAFLDLIAGRIESGGRR